MSTPGKLILMGEHAVVFGQPALVAAVNLRLRARLIPRNDLPDHVVELDLPQVDHHERLTWSRILDYTDRVREAWHRYAEDPDADDFSEVRGDDPAHVVKVALGEAAEFLGEESGPSLELGIDSDLPIGSGFGSSAAVAVAVLGGYMALRELQVSSEELDRLALEVERRQHGFPSGVDGATVLHGGTIWVEKSDEGEPEIEPLAGSPRELDHFRVFGTGTPAQSTGAVVAAVRGRVRRDTDRYTGVIEEMGQVTRSFRDALFHDDGSRRRIMDLVRRYETGLEELGVVPEAARSLVRAVEAKGGAAKISGAGALASPPGGPPGAGSLLVYHPEPDRIDEWGFLGHLPRYPVALGGEGLRRELAS